MDDYFDAIDPALDSLLQSPAQRQLLAELAKQLSEAPADAIIGAFIAPIEALRLKGADQEQVAELVADVFVAMEASDILWS